MTKVITAYVSPGTYKVVIDNERSAASRYQIKASISSLGTNDIEPNDFDHAMTLNKGAKMCIRDRFIRLLQEILM